MMLGTIALSPVRPRVETLRANEGGAWLEKFVDFYMSVRRTCDLSESCALQSMTPEVARADEGAKAAYEAELLKVVEAVAAGLSLLYRRFSAHSAALTEIS